MPEFVEIYEVSPRDGLQNERKRISLKSKIELVNLLGGCGFSRIEAGSFVSPSAVPQMADSAKVLMGATRPPSVKHTALTPNLRGFEKAVECEVPEVAVFVSASEGFSKANVNASVSESLSRAKEIISRAKPLEIDVRGYVSCVVDCPFEGAVDPDSVASAASRLFEMGCHEISLGDTTGQGRPETIDAMLTAVLEEIPEYNLAGHYHDTAGRALENISVSLEAGLRVFDSSVGGLGGCPFAPGAAGNVATEAVLDHLEALGYETRLDRGKVAEAARFARSLV